MKKAFNYLTVLFILVACACEKNRNRDFPNIAFEEFIYLNNPGNIELQHVGGATFHQGGFKGLIIYRRYNNGSANDFAGYDRGCPEHYREDCSTLEFTDDKTFARCECHGEKYLLFDGSPADGATISLMEYRTTFSGNVITVQN